MVKGGVVLAAAKVRRRSLGVLVNGRGGDPRFGYRGRQRGGLGRVSPRRVQKSNDVCAAFMACGRRVRPEFRVGATTGRCWRCGLAVRVDHLAQRAFEGLGHRGGRAGNRRQPCEHGRQSGRPHQDDEAFRPIRHLLLRGPVAELGGAVRGKRRIVWGLESRRGRRDGAKSMNKTGISPPRL